MGFTSARERRLWLLAGSCLLLVYSSLYIARPITEWLRAANLLRLAVGGSFLLAAAGVGYAILRQRPGWRVWISLAGIAAFYIVLLSRFELPEERLHFLEYGLIGGLVFAALLERQRHDMPEPAHSEGRQSPVWPAVTAIVITGIAGWIDEGIQEILPNRYYDLRDVAMNAVGGALAVVSMWILDLARRAEGGQSA